MAGPGGELVLVVDDEAAICKITEIILKRSGFQVMTAMSGPEAVAVYEQRGNEINVVLTDVSMPGMDGVALTRALRLLNPMVKVIASTGHADETRMAELRAIAVSGLINKPYDSRKLISSIRQILDLPEGEIQKF